MFLKYDVNLTHFQEVAGILLNLFLRFPTKREALTYGSATHRPDTAENEPHYIASFSKPSNVMRLLFQIRRRKFLTSSNMGPWLEGTAVISMSPFSAKLFLFLFALRRFVQRRFPFFRR